MIISSSAYNSAPLVGPPGHDTGASAGQTLPLDVSEVPASLLLLDPNVWELFHHDYYKNLPPPPQPVKPEPNSSMLPPCPMAAESSTSLTEMVPYNNSVTYNGVPYSSMSYNYVPYNHVAYNTTVYNGTNYTSAAYDGANYITEPYNGSNQSTDAYSCVNYQTEYYQGPNYASEPYQNMTYSSEPYPSTTYSSEPYPSTTYSSEPYQSTTYSSEPYQGTTYSREPYQGTAYSSESYQVASYNGETYQGPSYKSDPYPGMNYNSERYQGMNSNYTSEPYRETNYNCEPYYGMTYGNTANNSTDLSWAPVPQSAPPVQGHQAPSSMHVRSSPKRSTVHILPGPGPAPAQQIQASAPQQPPVAVPAVTTTKAKPPRKRRSSAKGKSTTLASATGTTVDGGTNNKISRKDPNIENAVKPFVGNERTVAYGNGYITTSGSIIKPFCGSTTVIAGGGTTTTANTITRKAMPALSTPYQLNYQIISKETTSNNMVQTVSVVAAPLPARNRRQNGPSTSTRKRPSRANRNKDSDYVREFRNEDDLRSQFRGVRYYLFDEREVLDAIAEAQQQCRNSVLALRSQL